MNVAIPSYAIQFMKGFMINLTELEIALKRMSARSKLYSIVKAEMQHRGRWKAKSRGIPFKPGHDDRRGNL